MKEVKPKPLPPEIIELIRQRDRENGRKGWEAKVKKHGKKKALAQVRSAYKGKVGNQTRKSTLSSQNFLI